MHDHGRAVQVRELPEDIMSSKRILIVDDSASSILWARTILAQARYEVQTAASGQQGLDTALAWHPDLILLDGAMPGMDGFETCRALRVHEATRMIPVVMVLARNAQGDAVAEAHRSGCNDCVMKPIDKTELLSKVRKLLVAQIGRVAPGERHVLRTVPRPVGARGTSSGSSAA